MAGLRKWPGLCRKPSHTAADMMAAPTLSVTFTGKPKSDSKKLFSPAYAICIHSILSCPLSYLFAPNESCGRSRTSSSCGLAVARFHSPRSRCCQSPADRSSVSQSVKTSALRGESGRRCQQVVVAWQPGLHGAAVEIISHRLHWSASNRTAGFPALKLAAGRANVRCGTNHSAQSLRPGRLSPGPPGELAGSVYQTNPP